MGTVITFALQRKRLMRVGMGNMAWHKPKGEFVPCLHEIKKQDEN
jgi:hypothetical protein